MIVPLQAYRHQHLSIRSCPQGVSGDLCFFSTRTATALLV